MWQGGEVRSMARLEGLRVDPVKGLDGVDVEATTVRPGGTLAHDREFALFDADGILNGKRTARVHDIATSFDPATAELGVETPDGETRRFALDSATGRDRAERWFGDFFGASVTLRRDAETGFVDRPEMGPSVVSTATLETVAGWFDGMTVTGARRRLRANVEVSGVPPFWEDRFVGDGTPAAEVGAVRLEGVTPCNRCIVPERDPDTGDPIDGFRERFVRKRRATFPDWADPEAFDGHYAVMLIAHVPEPDRGKTLRVGDPVAVVE